MAAIARKPRPHLNVLVAEDNPNDIALLEAIVRRDGVEVQLNFVRDGTEVIEYLRGVGQFGNRQTFPMPDLILLDLKMHLMSGLEVLDWRRKHPQCARIPAVMLSGSGLEKDVAQAYALGANTYFEKPSTLGEFTALIQALVQYWSRSKLPRVPGHC